MPITIPEKEEKEEKAMAPPDRPALDEAAIETLAALAEPLAAAREPWWLIGGAAVALHGIDIGPLADIDLILSAAEARRLLDALNIPLDEGGGSDRFRSRVFGHWRDAPIAVDVMGDFEVRTPSGWVPVQPMSREAFTVGGATLYAPSRGEVIAILRLFGRPKDLARADRLEGRAS
ncbi:MAG TPA: hypothetical protein VHY34_01250 [Caulobacteraceae bacterium]|nr:hypothetical protein [Caulobacteraceae bacterium]